jgi:hypothetical protein
LTPEAGPLIIFRRPVGPCGPFDNAGLWAGVRV